MISSLYEFRFFEHTSLNFKELFFKWKLELSHNPTTSGLRAFKHDHSKIRRAKTLYILYSQVNAYLRLHRMETCLRLTVDVCTAPVKERRQQMVSGGWSGKGNNLSKLLWSQDTGLISWGAADGGDSICKSTVLWDLSNLLSRQFYVPHCGHV